MEFRAKHFFARSLTLQESQIASGSRHPPVPTLPASLSSALFPSIHPFIFGFFFFFLLLLVALLVFSHSFILALVAVGPAGRHGTG